MKLIALFFTLVSLTSQAEDINLTSGGTITIGGQTVTCNVTPTAQAGFTSYCECKHIPSDFSNDIYIIVKIRVSPFGAQTEQRMNQYVYGESQCYSELPYISGCK